MTTRATEVVVDQGGAAEDNDATAVVEKAGVVVEEATMDEEATTDEATVVTTVAEVGGRHRRVSVVCRTAAMDENQRLPRLQLRIRLSLLAKSSPAVDLVRNEHSSVGLGYKGRGSDLSALRPTATGQNGMVGRLSSSSMEDQTKEFKPSNGQRFELQEMRASR